MLPISYKDLLRYGVFGIAVATIVAFGISPFTGGIVQQWSRSDAEARSRLVFNAIQPLLDRDVEDRAWSRLSDLFKRVALDKKILAVGFCYSRGTLVASTPEMPTDFSCEKLAKSEDESFASIISGGRRILVAAFPVSSNSGRSHLVILTDLSFAAARSSQVLANLLAALASVVLVLTVGTIIFAVLVLRRWMESLKRAVEEVRRGANGPLPQLSGSSIDREIHKLLRNAEHIPLTNQIDWTPQSLQEVLHGALPEAEVLVVSNREPYIHNHNASRTGIAVQRPASGLVSALEPIMRACGGTWIAHGSGSADRETVDEHDRLQAPESSTAYALRRIWISEEEQDGYYYGFANEGLWPLCRIVFVRPTFRLGDWQMYQKINQRFADAVVAEARTEDPVVLVHDYHFALVPRMIRQRLPKATIVTFWRRQDVIHLVPRHYEPADVFRLFRGADRCVVSSLHDGMNLVAKEFVSSREDNEGVLILSSFAGASRELSEALIVNPYDTEEMASAIERALSMPVEEQAERMRLMRQQIKENNVYRWAGAILLDAAKSRTRERVLSLATKAHLGLRPS